MLISNLQTETAPRVSLGFLITSYEYNQLTLLPENYSILHKFFQAWTLRIISQVHVVTNVKLQSFAINPMVI